MIRLCQLIAFALIGIAAAPGSAQILPPGAAPTRLATGYAFTEGPVYDRNGGVYFTNLVFSNQFNSDIVRYNIATGIATVVDPTSDGANGLYLDANGQVISADQATHRISRRSASDITVVEQVLANQWNGLGFNSPNDLVIDAAGGIYFSDPDYNNVRAQAEGVYYRTPAGVVNRILSGFARPNGVMLSPGGETFYLAVEGERRIMAYDVALDGSLSNERQFASMGTTNSPDGLAIDRAGNLYAAGNRSVWAWNPAGQLLFQLAMPVIAPAPQAEDPTNLEFGGADGRTLFITAGGSLYGIELNVPSPALGDFNGDALVDLADYTVWRDTLGTNANLSADGNGNRTIDVDDYDVWKARFGDTLGSGGLAPGHAAPEPGSLILFVSCIFLRRRR